MLNPTMEDESYIVRIYRRSPQYPEGDDGLVGVVEDIQHERRIAFHNLGELMALLTNHPTRPSVTRKRRNDP